MTREDAILCLKGIKNYGRDTFTEQSDWQESLDMAIKALEQEPCEDAISRQEVLDLVRADIEQIVSRYSISRERGGMGKVEWSDSLIKESEVLKILDKYKAETENI